MRSKTYLTAPDKPLYAIQRGDATLGFSQISEILGEPAIDFLGPLPAGIQYYTRFTVGISASSRQRGAAAALIEFLLAPRTRAAMARKGFEPY
jgi:molybdate transport system substrate-binding protein